MKRIIARFSYGGTAAVPSQNWGGDGARRSNVMRESAGLNARWHARG